MFKILLRYAGHVARVCERRLHIGIWLEDPERKRFLLRHVLVLRFIWILEKENGVLWIGFI